jgi:Zn-dependent membrane protease YugP
VHFLMLLVLLLVLIFGPQLWVRWVLARYNRLEESFPGTASEFARHLLDRFNLQHVRVEAAPQGAGDHYDPITQCVRLTDDKLERRSLTAITTAAHEVGHAIQHALGYGPFRLRLVLVRIAQIAEKSASFLLFAVPVLALVTRTPSMGLVTLVAAVAAMGVSLMVQLITLPVEWDASFKRAMPILVSGYLPADRHAEARQILRACALTYVASSLAGLLSFWRWVALLRR